jgi:hypothetical protein
MLPHEAMRGLAAALADVEEGRVNRAVALIFAEGGGSMLPLGAYHALVGEGEEGEECDCEGGDCAVASIP